MLQCGRWFAAHCAEGCIKHSRHYRAGTSSHSTALDATCPPAGPHSGVKKNIHGVVCLGSSQAFKVTYNCCKVWQWMDITRGPPVSNDSLGLSAMHSEKTSHPCVRKRSWVQQIPPSLFLPIGLQSLSGSGPAPQARRVRRLAQVPLAAAGGGCSERHQRGHRVGRPRRLAHLPRPAQRRVPAARGPVRGRFRAGAAAAPTAASAASVHIARDSHDVHRIGCKCGGLKAHPNFARGGGLLVLRLQNCCCPLARMGCFRSFGGLMRALVVPLHTRH